MATISSHGAAGVVTGSCHLLTIERDVGQDAIRIVIDCGMFQGSQEARNHSPFAFDAGRVDYLFLTHAHLDHVGRVPKLLKEGFSGVVCATAATRDIAEIILLDSAKIMREDYETQYRKAQRKGKEAEVPLPLYAEEDLEAAFDLDWRYPEYDIPMQLQEGLRVTFRNAGHILGSAFIEIAYMERGVEQIIVFSGDIGNNNDMVMPDLSLCPQANTLYVESTYGDRNHKSMEETISEFKHIVIKTLNDWGNVIIPSFAVERTQEILCILKEMHEAKELPECKVFLDSPMATRATEVYNNYASQLSKKCQEYKKRDGSIFDFEGLTFTPDVEASRAINAVDRRAIIIAGSGMCTGGRILHHFKNRLWNRKNAVVFVGYQVEGTLGRRMIDGARWITLYHEEILIRASIHTINGFSAHADQSAIVRWVSQIKDLHRIFLIHGEENKQLILRSVLENVLEQKVHIVKPEEVIYL